MQIKDNQSKQHFFPVRDEKDPYKVRLEPITEHLYHQLMPEIWKTQKRMQRSGQCACPQSKLWTCDADCLICPYRAAGRNVSLDTPLDGAEDLTLEDTIAGDDTRLFHLEGGQHIRDTVKRHDHADNDRVKRDHKGRA